MRLVRTLPSATRMPPAVIPPVSVLVSQRTLPVAYRARREAVRRGEIDHVLEDAEILVPRRPRVDVLRIVAHVFPDQVAVGGVDRLHGAARHIHVHDAAIDDRRRFLRAGGQAARPGHAQLPDIVLVDLIERAVAMLVEGPADHQPVGGIGIGQHLLGDRLEIGGLRGGVRCGDAQQCGRKADRDPGHEYLPVSCVCWFCLVPAALWCAAGIMN